ncbi:hypothetical protein [Sinomonas gamaensis]|uniref:hypothetical protein n=1 Tax=Sinomonas gamaensis TaxID=2565624 RepID=UPI00110936DC|nr:hypothetical protein [Sinomonas gamaensis]
MNDQISHQKDNLGTNQNPATAPEGWEPNYDWKSVDPVTGETEDDPDSIIDFRGPSISRPGFTILRAWSPSEGLLFWVDHIRDEAYTLDELRDLRDQLDAVLREAQG